MGKKEKDSKEVLVVSLVDLKIAKLEKLIQALKDKK